MSREYSEAEYRAVYDDAMRGIGEDLSAVGAEVRAVTASLANQIEIMKTLRHQVLLELANEIDPCLHTEFVRMIDGEEKWDDEELLGLLDAKQPGASEEFGDRYAAAIDAESSSPERKAARRRDTKASLLRGVTGTFGIFGAPRN